MIEAGHLDVLHLPAHFLDGVQQQIMCQRPRHLDALQPDRDRLRLGGNRHHALLQHEPGLEGEVERAVLPANEPAIGPHGHFREIGAGENPIAIRLRRVAHAAPAEKIPAENPTEDRQPKSPARHEVRDNDDDDREEGAPPRSGPHLRNANPAGTARTVICVPVPGKLHLDAAVLVLLDRGLYLLRPAAH